MVSHGFQSLTGKSPKIYAVMNEEYEIKSNCGSLMGDSPHEFKVFDGV